MKKVLIFSIMLGFISFNSCQKDEKKNNDFIEERPNKQLITDAYEFTHSDSIIIQSITLDNEAINFLNQIMNFALNYSIDEVFFEQVDNGLIELPTDETELVELLSLKMGFDSPEDFTSFINAQIAYYNYLESTYSISTLNINVANYIWRDIILNISENYPAIQFIGENLGDCTRAYLACTGDAASDYYARLGLAAVLSVANPLAGMVAAYSAAREYQKSVKQCYCALAHCFGQNC